MTQLWLPPVARLLHHPTRPHSHRSLHPSLPLASSPDLLNFPTSGQHSAVGHIEPALCGSVDAFDGSSALFIKLSVITALLAPTDLFNY